MTDKIWLKSYPKNVPHEINPRAYSSLVELFEDCCKKFADQPAISNFGNVLSYAELESRSRDFAAYLQKTLGLKKGDKLAIMLPNILQYHVALFGALRAGLVVVNINPLYTARELEYELNNAEVETIIVLSNFAHNLELALPKLSKLKNIIITELGDLFQPLKAWIAHFLLKYIKKAIPKYHLPNAISFKTVINTGKQLTFEAVEIQYEDLAFLQYTGGTTGVVKGAMLMHGNILANVEQTLAWVNDQLRMREEVFIAPLPLYHIYSLTVCAFCFMKLGGQTVLITNPRDLRALIKELSKTTYTVFVGINTLFNALLNHPEFSQLNFKHLRLTITGGMPMQASVAERWRRVTGNPVTEGYGLTEASPVVTINPLNVSDYTGSIGLPLPSTDITIKDDKDQDLPIGEVGELCIKGPQVMQYYWNNDEETKKVFTKDGWLRTGDMTYMDEKGFLYIVDRKKDMILVSGFNVYPNEIEEVISSHPGVDEVAVVGIPSDATGEAIKAFVVKKDITLSKEELMAFCKERLTAYKLPKFMEFRESLPKSSVGKILRRKLREEARLDQEKFQSKTIT